MFSITARPISLIAFFLISFTTNLVRAESCQGGDELFATAVVHQVWMAEDWPQASQSLNNLGTPMIALISDQKGCKPHFYFGKLGSKEALYRIPFATSDTDGLNRDFKRETILEEVIGSILFGVLLTGSSILTQEATADDNTRLMISNSLGKIVMAPTNQNPILREQLQLRIQNGMYPGIRPYRNVRVTERGPLLERLELASPGAWIQERIALENQKPDCSSEIRSKLPRDGTSGGDNGP